MSLLDSVKDFGKQKINQAVAPIKAKLILALGIALIVFIVIMFGIAVITAIAGTQEDTDLTLGTASSWEQFLKYVAIKEGGGTSGDYYVVEDDGEGNPTVGHGLCIKSSDGYLHVDEFAAYGIDSKSLSMGDQVSKEICDAIWSEHIKGLYEGIVSSYSELGLTEYQCYALTDVKYRRGNTSDFKSEYESKWSSSDNQYGNYNESNESFSTDTLFNFFWNGGHSLEGVNTRKKDQWVLFKYGYYRPLNEYWQETATFSGDLYNEDGSVNEDKISEYETFLTQEHSLVTPNLSGNNIGGRYNKAACTAVTGKYHGYSGNTSSTSYNDAKVSYLGNNGLGIYQCTWWANGRASEYLGKQVSNNGNGGEVANNLIKAGYGKSVDNPVPNSVISYSGGSEYGHVAYVEAVDNINGYYYISHAGSGKSWYGIQKVKIGSAPWSGWSIVAICALGE